MARSVRKSFKSANDGTGGPAAHGANDDALLKQAQDNVRTNHEATRQNLLHLQGLEIKHLENERKFITQEKARDVTAFNNKEIAAINQRYDRLVHRTERRNNSFLGQVARVFGAHKRQQRRIVRINAERDAMVIGAHQAACAQRGAAPTVADAAGFDGRKGPAGGPRKARRGAGKAAAGP
jgi:hypothetical protein